MSLRKGKGSMAYRDSAPLVGRAAEQAMIAGLLTRSAHGSALLIRGAPGTVSPLWLMTLLSARAGRGRSCERRAHHRKPG